MGYARGAMAPGAQFLRVRETGTLMQAPPGTAQLSGSAWPHFALVGVGLLWWC